MNTSYDYLIVGQGIAGTCLAIRLLREGKSVLIVNDSSLSCTSRVAAGFMHPITGRRIVKTWMADHIFPLAADFYLNLEKESGKSFYRPMESVEMVSDIRMANEWSQRCEQLPDYIQHIHEKTNDYLQPFKALYKVRGGGWLDLPTLLDHYHSNWTDAGILVDDNFKEEDLDDNDFAIRWKDRLFQKVVFCQGVHARSSEIWGTLPFNPAKGELLTVYIPDLPQHEIIVHGIFLIPIGNGNFRAGSTYSWHELTGEITLKAREELEKKIANTITSSFTIIEQQAGVRPAVKDRRPLLGKHPLKENLFVFNGLGSKGSSLAPWLSACMVEYLERKKPLPAEADIRRLQNQ